MERQHSLSFCCKLRRGAAKPRRSSMIYDIIGQLVKTRDMERDSSLWAFAAKRQKLLLARKWRLMIAHCSALYAQILVLIWHTLCSLRGQWFGVYCSRNGSLFFVVARGPILDFINFWAGKERIRRIPGLFRGIMKRFLAMMRDDEGHLMNHEISARTILPLAQTQQLYKI